jgi:hypothetical protein
MVSKSLKKMPAENSGLTELYIRSVQEHSAVRSFESLIYFSFANWQKKCDT